ncbi:glucokinase [Nostoc sp.]|uniref:glucokinase n=1 Tax=Nostoc sp. TaxID=1180 RepID=UPI002FF6B7F8
MTILLVGDIGGTNTTLRLVESEPQNTVQELPHQTTLYECTYASQEYSDLVSIVREFLVAADQNFGSQITLERACFGIAGPVVNNISQLTNLGWMLDKTLLENELQISEVRLINDFVAVGYGVLGLSPQEDLHTLQPGRHDANAPIAVIGAGTGLGQGFLIPQLHGYRVFATEGGHADFAPQSELEFELLQYLLEKYNINHVSVERVVSGMGIAAIYQFLREIQGYQESPALAQISETWEQEIGQEHKTVDLAAKISFAAVEQEDYLCQRTMELFVQVYGAEAGNLALKIMPYGGLYIAGGIAAKNLSLMRQGNFMQAFLKKGRMNYLLQEIPVHMILNPKVGLIGAALYLCRPTDF